MTRTRYLDIADALANDIAGLAGGTRVPGEREIGERFGVGRAAARSALQELERRMLVRRVRGAGTFTARRIDYRISLDAPPSWSRTVRASGAVPRTVVRSCEPGPMPADVARHLGREPGLPCHLLRRLSYTDELPASWGHEWVPVELVPDLHAALQAVDSLDQVLRTLTGSVPERAWVRASMEYAEQDAADELGCSPGDAVWLVESLNRDATTGRPLYFTRRWIRADAVRVVVEAAR